MNMKLILSTLLVTSLIGCSSSNDGYSNTNSEVTVQQSPQTLKKRQNYVKSCSEQGDKDLCGCQFDALDPILSKSIGDDWSTTGMQEENFDKYVMALEVAVEKCS